MDELGVLLMGHAKGAYWYGSRLTIEEARALVPAQQRDLAAGDASRCWPAWSGRIENPNAGVVEADEMDHARMLEICLPYLGEMAGVYSRLDAAAGSRGAVPRGHRSAIPGSSPTSASSDRSWRGALPLSRPHPAKGRKAL